MLAVSALESIDHTGPVVGHIGVRRRALDAIAGGLVELIHGW